MNGKWKVRDMILVISTGFRRQLFHLQKVVDLLPGFVILLAQGGWLTVCSQVKRIKQHPEMSSSCLKLVPERQELSRDFIMFLRSLNGNSLIMWITTLRPSCIIRLQHFNDVYANRKLPTFLKSLIENIVK